MPNSGFNAFGLPAKLSQALARMKFTTPTPIQEQTIPLALQGRDVLGSAQTGTGKTGAFGIPVIAGLMANPEAAALIMTPTRELAGQVMAALVPMIPTQDIRTAVLIGGEPMPRQYHQLRNNPRLIVGTPGRINDHLERGTLKLGNVRFLVLDETDRMLDMGFGVQIERILKHVSDDRQTLLFSATMPHNINKLSGRYMKDPVRVAVGSTTDPVAKIKQEIIPTTDAEKYGKLLEELTKRKGSIIIFVKTKHGTEKLADKLTKAEFRADAIHGDLQQRRRERVIQNFRDKKFRILVATDVAARGLDIPHIEHVVNYDMPQAPEDYIHRIGRTARAGAEGEAISFLTGADGVKWRAIQRLLNGEDPNAPGPRSGGGGARRGFGGRGRSPDGGGRGGSRDGGRDGGARKPFWKKDGDRSTGGDKPRGERTERPHSERVHADRPHADRPHSERVHSDRPHSDKPRSERVHSDRPHSEKPRGERSERPHSERAHSDRPHSDKPRSERVHSDRLHSDKPRSERVHSDRLHSDKPRSERPHSDRPHSDKPRSERPHSDRPHSDKPRSEKFGGNRDRAERAEGVKTWSDKPRGERKTGDKPRGDRPFGGKSYGGKPAGRKPPHAK